ncbi:MAG: hypothetical protein GTO58_19575 [Hydrogenophaga sp.]|nr:hypothetical protein [Hydrogenophaga sp.]
MITIVIVAIGIALMLPSWDAIVQRRELTQGTEEISTLLSIAQGEAVKRGEVIEVDVNRAGGNNWCVRVFTEDDDGNCLCNPDAPNAPNGYCGWTSGVGEQGGEEVDAYRKFTITQLLEGGTSVGQFDFRFDPIRGLKMADDDTTDFSVHAVQLQSANTDFTLRVEVNATGRVRICSPDDSVMGFGSCL